MKGLIRSANWEWDLGEEGRLNPLDQILKYRKFKNAVNEKFKKKFKKICLKSNMA